MNARDWATGEASLPIVQFALDGLAWAVAIPFATVARLATSSSPIRSAVAGVACAVLAAVTVQGIIGMLLGLYCRRYHYGRTPPDPAAACGCPAHQWFPDASDGLP